jgi:uncharacterized protein YdhG (YjbR/CyaY superfamily)
VRSILERIRVTIKKAAPDAEEKISYQMPTFTLKGHLVYFGAFKKHIGFYPPVRDKKLRLETSVYEGESRCLPINSNVRRQRADAHGEVPTWNRRTRQTSSG